MMVRMPGVTDWTRHRLDLYMRMKTHFIADDLALAPANQHVANALARLEKECPQHQPPPVFDANPKKPFPVPVSPYETLDPNRTLFVLSPNYAEAITTDLRARGHQKIFTMGHAPEPVEYLAHQKAMLTVFELAARDHVQRLAGLIDRDRLLVIIHGPMWYDLYEKADLLRFHLDAQIIWITAAVVPHKNDRGVIEANFQDVFLYVRDEAEQVLFLPVHGMTFTETFLFQKLFPKAKTISYVYDWLEHSVPYEWRERLMTGHANHDDWILSEYRTGRAWLTGMADGIIYKDGGPDFALYRETFVPNLFFPTYLPSSLFQSAATAGPPLKMVFIGTLFGRDDSPEMNGHSMFFDLFREVVNQGLELDVYYLAARTPPEVVADYRAEYASGLAPRLVEGKPLDRLLPELAGRYHWGFMIAAAGFGLASEHAAHTLPSRVFAYAALGIPIVVSRDFGYLAELVARHGIGVVVTRGEIDRLAQILADADYASLCDNVRAFREKNRLENHAARFCDFVRDILAGRVPRKTTSDLE